MEDSLLIKDYIPHLPELALHRIDPVRLRPEILAQIRQFLHITRGLLADTRPHPAIGGEASMLPDIIDQYRANLVIDTRTGDLTLIDTNRLISTHKLAQLHANARAELAHDPLYSRYLNSAEFEELFAASAAADEHIP